MNRIYDTIEFKNQGELEQLGHTLASSKRELFFWQISRCQLVVHSTTEGSVLASSDDESFFGCKLFRGEHIVQLQKTSPHTSYL